MKTITVDKKMEEVKALLFWLSTHTTKHTFMSFLRELDEETFKWVESNCPESAFDFHFDRMVYAERYFSFGREEA